MLKKLFFLISIMVGALQSGVAFALPQVEASALEQTLAALPESCWQEGAQDWSVESVERLQQLYQAVDYRELWQDAARREQLQQQLLDMRYDGLEPQMYQVSRLVDESVQGSRLCSELLASQSYLQALQDLAYGVLDFAEVEPYWIEAESAGISQVSIVGIALQGLVDVSRAFEAARPSHRNYQLLRQGLKEAGMLEIPGWPVVAAGRTLRVGDTDVRVPDLRKRLLLGGYLPQSEEDSPVESQLYSTQLGLAVLSFQEDHYLEADAVVGPATLRELNISAAQRLQQVRINLERGRWLQRLLEPNMLVVDIAGARLFYFRDGELVWRTRTQVGTVKRQTPLLKSRITHLTINPTWTVPPTIMREDTLPKIRNDLGYLARNNMQVLDYQGTRLDPAVIDWSHPAGLMVRQGPGPQNSLGLLAIRFANPFLVYLHDTPSQHLFGRATRTVSSGCVRVDGAQTLLEHLLHGASAKERERVAQIQNSGKTRNVNLSKPVPVLLAYWTAEFDDRQRLRFHSDSYGHDARLMPVLEAALQRR